MRTLLLVAKYLVIGSVVGYAGYQIGLPPLPKEPPFKLIIGIRSEAIRHGANVLYIDTADGYLTVTGEDDNRLMQWLIMHRGRKVKLTLEQ